MNTDQAMGVSKQPGEPNHDWLKLNPEIEADKICKYLRQTIFEGMHKQGAVIGISGGIDSSVTLALAVRAIGSERVVGVLMPERESNPESMHLAQDLADGLGVKTVIEYISDALEGYKCYARRDEAIKRLIPEYRQPDWSAKIVLPSNLLNQNTMNLFRLVVTAPDGREMSVRLPKGEFQQIVAASNFKQRTRMSMLYYHAELRNYAVIGTANKNEYELGFFVKYGDGGVDISPIQHLYKTQIFQLAEYLRVSDEILKRVPTTDTYPGGSTQEEFFYRVPFNILDTVWAGFENGSEVGKIANMLGLREEQVTRVISDIQSKQRSTKYLRMTPIKLVE